MQPPPADFWSIKQRIPIDRVLARYGVKLRSVGPHTLCGPCPLPTHYLAPESRQLLRESFAAGVVLPLRILHRRPPRPPGRRVIDLVAILEGCSLRQVGIRLQDWFGGSVPASHRAPLRPVAVDSYAAQPNRPLGFALQGIDTQHRYLTQRGISPATAQWFGVGMYPGAGFLTGRCVIPIRDEKGRLIAYAGRAELKLLHRVIHAPTLS